MAELCEICGKMVTMTFGRRVNVSPKNGDNCYFCSEECDDKWTEREFG